MQRFSQRLVLVLAFVFASPYWASAYEHDSNCDKQNMDVSKLSSEDKAALLEKCTAQLRAEDCGIGGVDLSMMSAADQNAMKEACVDKMKHMGCDVKAVNLTEISVADTQKLMDQCHDKVVSDERAKAAKAAGASVGAPAPKAG